MELGIGFLIKKGLTPIPAPTYFTQHEETSIGTILSSDQLQNTTRAWHEYLGILWAKIKG